MMYKIKNKIHNNKKIKIRVELLINHKLVKNLLIEIMTHKLI